MSTLTGPVRLGVAPSEPVDVLGEEPALFQRVAATWHARWCTFLP